MRDLRSILLTGGAGFIGSALARHLLRTDGLETLIVVDKLGARGRRGNLIGPDQDSRFVFVEGDIHDPDLIPGLLQDHKVTGLFNLAADTDFGSSQHSAVDLTAANVLGTARILDQCGAAGVPLLQCSTSKVYGPVSPPGRSVEINPLKPVEPSIASKASADLLCLAAAHHQDQDVVITRCSDNYGPRQSARQMIPGWIQAAFQDQPLAIEGHGTQIRDWIHVDDHCRGMIAAFLKGHPGSVYLLGGQCERTDIGIARSILEVLEKPSSLLSIQPGIEGSPAPTKRYAVDFSKATAGLSWRPQERFRSIFPLVVREIAGNLRGEISS
ncbi:MAG TPA: dTDP-glucose 4,6-dehydratase [Verrucomicrobiales bacterium]|nr:dTDP-glucose 4,6-dehydratase [Verrucomicrobiales bacterium]